MIFVRTNVLNNHVIVIAFYLPIVLGYIQACVFFYVSIAQEEHVFIGMHTPRD